MHKLLQAVAVFALALSVFYWPKLISAAEEDVQGFLLASSCAACHGPDGQSPGAIPSLAGKDGDYIATALQEYKAGTRSATVMNRLAKGYSDDEIATIARWFASRN